MIEAFNSAKYTFGVLQKAAKTGVLVEAHAHACPPTVPDVAAFLVAAEEHSYYGCGPWYEPAARFGGGGPHWFGDFYDRPLGPPTGPATVAGKLWRRSFGKGTSVAFDAGTFNATIRWADGTVHTGP